MTKQELRGKYYKMLVQFTGGNLPTHDRLLSLGYSEQDIEEARKYLLIEEAGESSFGIVMYKIGPHGEEIRDK